MPKGIYLAEKTSNSDKIKSVALAIIELRLSEGISQYKISLNKKKFKFHSNFFEAFQVILKTISGLIIPNRYCQSAMKVL